MDIPIMDIYGEGSCLRNMIGKSLKSVNLIFKTLVLSLKKKINVK